MEFNTRAETWRVLERLGAVMNGDKGKARCPAHDDRRPSLWVVILPGGRLYLRCMAGCSIQAVTRAIGLPLECYGVPPRKGVRVPMAQRTIVATYDYKDEKGVLRYQKVRYHPKDFVFRRPDGKGGWLWNMEGMEHNRLLYGLPEIVARPEQPVLVVEGEKDVDTLRKYGLVGATNDGGAGHWQSYLGHFLRGRRVAIIPDRDDAGHKHALDVAARLLEYVSSLRVVHLPGPDSGDVTDFLEARLPGVDDAKAKAALLDYIRRTPEWRRVEAAKPAAG